MSQWNSRPPFEENWYYHIYNRWYNKSIIFNNRRCFEKFFEYLEYNLNLFKDYFKLISYCILPNHFHFIIHILQNNGTSTKQNKKVPVSVHSVSKFMKQLQWSYSVWHRNKFPLEFKQPFFEWRFKAKQIFSEEYLQKCFYYVNYNPIKHWIVGKIEDWPYSSIHQFIDTGTQPGNNIPVYKTWIQLKEFADDFEEFEF